MNYYKFIPFLNKIKNEVGNDSKRSKPRVGKVTKFKPQEDNIKMSLTTGKKSVINLWIKYRNHP